MQSYGSKQLDASLLQMPLVGFLPPTDPRIRGTLRAIEEKLLIKDEFVLRYEIDKASTACLPVKAHFWSCSFWLVDNYVLQGRYDEAESCSNSCCRAAMTWDCWPKSLIHQLAGCWGTFHKPIVTSASSTARLTLGSRRGQRENVLS